MTDSVSTVAINAAEAAVDARPSMIQTPIVNRDATSQDAQDLLAGYKILVEAKRELTKATKATDEAWLESDVHDAMCEARADRRAKQEAYDTALDTVWHRLALIPKGTVAPGGMTPQTVGLEFFNKNLNRDGGRRLTASQARKINVLSASL